MPRCRNGLFAVSSSRGDAVSVPPTANAITIGEHSKVCVSVHVDQRIWPRPLDADSARIFSGYLMPEVHRLYVERGGSNFLPGTHNQARFVADASGTNPYCQDRETDVFVDVRYGPRDDGTPFRMEYHIRRGAAVRSGRIEVDVVEEIRAGRLQGFHQRRTIKTVIIEDMRARAPMIADQLLIEKH